MPQYTISIALYRRPYYTKLLLDALDKCYNIDKYTIIISCDIYRQTFLDEKNLYRNSVASLEIAKKFRPSQTQIYTNQPIIGCNSNTYKCLNLGFEFNDDFHIHFEDDTIPSKDALLYFEWCRNYFRYNYSIFSISGYSKSSIQPIDHYDKLIKRQWFTPWGWATWKDRYCDIHNTISGCRHYGWDMRINNCTRQNRYEIAPVISRIQNIGAEDGENVTPEYHKEHQYNEFWIESIKKYSYSFDDISVL